MTYVILYKGPYPSVKFKRQSKFRQLELCN